MTTWDGAQCAGPHQEPTRRVGSLPPRHRLPSRPPAQPPRRLLPPLLQENHTLQQIANGLFSDLERTRIKHKETIDELQARLRQLEGAAASRSSCEVRRLVVQMYASGSSIPLSR